MGKLNEFINLGKKTQSNPFNSFYGRIIIEYFDFMPQDLLINELKDKYINKKKLNGIASRKWREKNPEKHKQSVENWRSRNKESILEKARKYREEHREEIRAKKRSQVLATKRLGNKLLDNQFQDFWSK